MPASLPALGPALRAAGGSRSTAGITVTLTAPSAQATGFDEKTTVQLVTRRRRRPKNNLKEGKQKWADEKYFVD